MQDMEETSRPVPVVLLTRPLAASHSVARALESLSAECRVVISPILEIEHLNMSTQIDTSTVLALSSAHAVAALQSAGLAQGQRAYCVGDATAQAARALGLEAVSAGGTSADLTRLITEKEAPCPILWLRGEHVRGALVKDLSDAGFKVTETVIYRQKEVPLSAEAREILRDRSAVVLPIYSPRSAALLGRACADATAPLEAIFISQASADSWQGPTLRSVEVASQTDGAAMLDAVSCRIAATSRG